MRAFWLLALLMLSAQGSEAQTVRYFGVWSYTENAPSEEISPENLGARKLGYWSLELDEEAAVRRGTYHGSTGTVWLSLEYVRMGERIYADLYTATGRLVTRKSTQLRDLRPKWPDR